MLDAVENCEYVWSNVSVWKRVSDDAGIDGIKGEVRT